MAPALCWVKAARWLAQRHGSQQHSTRTSGLNGEVYDRVVSRGEAGKTPFLSGHTKQTNIIPGIYPRRGITLRTTREMVEMVQWLVVRLVQ